MRQFTVKVITPDTEFEYRTTTAPRLGEDIYIDGKFNKIYTVMDLCHMLKRLSGDGETTLLDYILVRDE